MDRVMDWKGKVLRRRYRLDERIAIGRTVEVFRAFDLLEEEEVVVKLPLPHLLSDADFCDNFRSASYRATRLHHQGIVQTLDYGLEEGRPFVVMELVNEKTLRELLEAGRKMKSTGALYFAVELGKTLAYLHGQGLTHGSLDEGHVFVFPARKAKVSDPGFPSVLGGGESPYPFSLDPRRDMQDLGYLMYRSLTGRSKDEAIADVKKGKLKWDPEVPERLRRFVQNCMDSMGQGGFASSEQMVREAISTFREEQPMAAVPQVEPVEEPPEEVEATRPFTLQLPRLKRWQVWVGAAFLAVAVVVLVVFLFSTFISGDKVEVPNLVNRSVEESAKLARENDLGLLVVGEEYDSDIKADYIISQDPEGGVMVERKTTIRVLKSMGPLTVPNLVGLSLEDARTVLESRGFRVGEIVYREVPGYSEGRVVETDPPYGSKLSGGEAVNLVVNKTGSQ
jgi:eukaryotic-like serine/threonine-protein kinase